MVIASTYIPHDQTPDIPRQHAWDLLDETITQTPIAKNLLLLGDLNSFTRQKRRRRRLHRGTYFWERNAIPYTEGNIYPSLEN